MYNMYNQYDEPDKKFEALNFAFTLLAHRVESIEAYYKFPPVRIHRNWLGVPISFETSEFNAIYDYVTSNCLTKHSWWWIRFNAKWCTFNQKIYNKVRYSWPWHIMEDWGNCYRCGRDPVRLVMEIGGVTDIHGKRARVCEKCRIDRGWWGVRSRGPTV